LAIYRQQRQQLEEVVKRLRDERAKVEQLNKLKQKLSVVSEGQSRVAATIAKAQTLNAEKGDLQETLELYSDLRGIDRTELQQTTASAATLEQAMLDEGIQFEIQPEQTLNVTVQRDGGTEEHAILSDARTVSARTEITVQIPGLARLQLINLSQSARQLADARRTLEEMLTTVGAKDIQSVVDRFASYDELAKKLDAAEVTLQTLLEERSFEDWQAEAASAAFCSGRHEERGPPWLPTHPDRRRSWLQHADSGSRRTPYNRVVRELRLSFLGS
jgi:hypothetical protein